MAEARKLINANTPSHEDLFAPLRLRNFALKSVSLLWRWPFPGTGESPDTEGDGEDEKEVSGHDEARHLPGRKVLNISEGQEVAQVGHQ
jgi:hypothetical protein